MEVDIVGNYSCSHKHGSVEHGCISKTRYLETMVIGEKVIQYNFILHTLQFVLHTPENEHSHSLWKILQDDPLLLEPSHFKGGVRYTGRTESFTTVNYLLWRELNKNNQIRAPLSSHLSCPFISRNLQWISWCRIRQDRLFAVNKHVDQIYRLKYLRKCTFGKRIP